MHMKVFEMFFAFEVLLARPTLTNLLQQKIPFSLVPVPARRFGAEVAKGIVGNGPTFKMPDAGLAVRSADLGAVFLQQGADGDVPLHGGEHFNPDGVQPYDREVIVERR